MWGDRGEYFNPSEPEEFDRRHKEEWYYRAGGAPLAGLGSVPIAPAAIGALAGSGGAWNWLAQAIPFELVGDMQPPAAYAAGPQFYQATRLVIAGAGDNDYSVPLKSGSRDTQYQMWVCDLTGRLHALGYNTCHSASPTRNGARGLCVPARYDQLGQGDASYSNPNFFDGYYIIVWMEPQAYWGVVQADWTPGTTQYNNYCTVRQCIDHLGGAPLSPITPFKVYLPGCGDQAPAVYAADNGLGDWPAFPGDVIQFAIDNNPSYTQTSNSTFATPVAVGSYLGAALGTVVEFPVAQTGGLLDTSKIPYGWHLCDGSNPSGNLLGMNLPNQMGLYSRCAESTVDMWADNGAGPGSTIGPAADGSGGTLQRGVSSTRQTYLLANGMTEVVTGLEDVQSWAHPGVGDATANDAVVAPPTFVTAKIIRCK